MTRGGPTEPRGDALLPRLDAFLGERWPICRGRIVADAGGRPALSLRELLEAGRLERCLRRFAGSHPGGDFRAVASLWAQWYLVTTWPPLVASILALGAAPRLDPETAAVILDDKDRPAGLRVAPAAERYAPAAVLERLVRTHAAPLLEAVAGIAGLSDRVPWGNAASVLSWSLDELEERIGRSAVAPGRALLARACWADGSPNPLSRACRGNGADIGRRTCCLRYRPDAFGYCSDCPVPPHRRAVPAQESA